MNQNARPIHRKRTWYVLILIFIIILGIGSRQFFHIFPAAFGKYPGDTLWTIAVFLLWGIALPKVSTLKIAGLSLLTSYLDEISQLYQAPWLTEIRNTYIGHIILGSAFDWIDLIAYTIGAILAFVMEAGILPFLFKYKK